MSGERRFLSRDSSLLAVSSRGRRGYRALGWGVSLLRALISFMSPPLSWPNHLPKVPPSNTIILEIRLQHLDLVGWHTNILSIRKDKRKILGIPPTSLIGTLLNSIPLFNKFLLHIKHCPWYCWSCKYKSHVNPALKCLYYNNKTCYNNSIKIYC